MSKPIISIVLGTYNRLNFLKQTIKSIRQEQKRLSVLSEIIVVDGGSNDGTISWLAKQKDIILIVQHNRGFWNGKPIKRQSWGYFMNLGFKCTQGTYICMLSDDCLLVPNALVNSLNCFEKRMEKGEKIGSLAFFWRDIPQNYTDWSKPGEYFIVRPTSTISLVNHGIYLKKALEEINYIDEETFTFYHADTDLCLKLEQKGYFCDVSPDSYVEHY